MAVERTVHPNGTWRAKSISQADRTAAVKRVVSSAASKVRITQGHRRNIVAGAKRRAR